MQEIRKSFTLSLEKGQPPVSHFYQCFTIMSCWGSAWSNKIHHHPFIAFHANANTKKPGKKIWHGMVWHYDHCGFDLLHSSFFARSLEVYPLRSLQNTDLGPQAAAGQNGHWNACLGLFPISSWGSCPSCRRATWRVIRNNGDYL